MNSYPMSRYYQVPVTIAAGAAKSSMFDTLGYRIVGVKVPAATEGAYLRFYADPDGTDDTGALATNAAGEDIRATYGTLPEYYSMKGYGTNVGELPPAARYAIETATAGSATNQSGAAATLIVVMEPIG